MRTIVWFRKTLRVHDNPSLCAAVARSSSIIPLYILDDWHANPDNIGDVRLSFIMQSLEDLHQSLVRLGAKPGLCFVRGNAEEVLPKLFRNWNVQAIAFDDHEEMEPHSRETDRHVKQLAQESNVQVLCKHAHQLHDLAKYQALPQVKSPTTFKAFLSMFQKLGRVPAPVPSPGAVPCSTTSQELADAAGLKSLSIAHPRKGSTPFVKFPGGETVALLRLKQVVQDRESWVATFEKPQTSPNTLEPSTSVLSPYITHGCLSSRHVYHVVAQINSKNPRHPKPPTSFHGQLLFREMWYVVGWLTKANLSQMRGNPICRDIPWDHNPVLLDAWASGRTGYPFIDAIMTQLREEGWIHHLARHAVACFLTRGDLWVSWEEGFKVFDRLLIDADWTINGCNWHWVSCSAFFHQYFRCYSPVAFGRKTDKDGEFIRKYLPVLAKMPTKYIYEPWKAPLAVQKRANCIVGVDYPMPVVDHAEVVKRNQCRMKAVFNGDQNRVKAGDQSRVKAGDQSRVKVGDQSRVKVGDQSRVKAGDQSRVKVGDQSRVKAGDQSRVKAGDQSRAKAALNGTTAPFPKKQCVRAVEIPDNQVPG